MTTNFDHPRGSNPLDLAVVRTVFVVNLCSRPDCEHPILFTTTERERAEEKLHELAKAATEPDFRLDLYRIDSLMNDEDIYTPLLHVDIHGTFEL